MKKINGVIRAWCTYDLANSVYNLVINTAIFPIYYTAITSVNNEDKVDFFGFEMVNSVLYSYAISLSYLISALLLPGIGTVDHLRMAAGCGVTTIRVATHCTEANVSRQHINLAQSM